MQNGNYEYANIVFYLFVWHKIIDIFVDILLQKCYNLRMNDVKFARRCGSGDTQAWEEFVKRYSRLMYSVIYQVLKTASVPGATQETTDGLFHDILVALSDDNGRKLRSYRGKNGCSLASWLKQVTLHHVIDHLRRASSTVSLDAEDGQGGTLKEKIVDTSGLQDAAAEEQEKLMYLKECIAALCREDKYFLELHVNQGVPLRRVGRHLRISRAAADMRKRRIMQRLRRCFKRKGYAWEEARDG